jgi:hypothetical protein
MNGALSQRLLVGRLSRGKHLFQTEGLGGIPDPASVPKLDHYLRKLIEDVQTHGVGARHHTTVFWVWRLGSV